MILKIGGGEGGIQAIKMQYNYSKKMFTPGAKPMWIIGDVDNWRSG
jgi:hypothetical protein